MKKRLLSLLLAVAMMVALVPTAAFAGDEAGTVNSDLRINANGIPYNASDDTQNQNNESVSGNGWEYTHGTTLSWLDLGIDSTYYNFDLSSQSALNCEVDLYGGSISGGTFNKTISVPNNATGDFTISGGVFHGPIYFSDSNSSASLKVTGGIFTDSATGFYGQTSRITIEGGIFVNNPNVTNKYALSVTNGGKIKKLEIGNTKIAMDTANLYIVGTLDRDLNLTLDDGTVHTVTPDMVKYSSGSTLPKHIPLTIKEDGTPNVDGMTLIDGEYYVSDNWYYRLGIYGNPYLTLGSSFSDAIGPYPVSCEVVNDGTITGGVFTKTVSGSGTITGGIFLEKPNNINVHTIIAGKDGSGTFTNLTVGDQSVALNTNKLYVVGIPSSELTVAVKNNYETTYNFVIPAGSLTTDLTLDTLYSTGSKKLEIKADRTPDTSGAFYYYHSSYPNDITYFGDGWHYYSTNDSGKSTLYLDSDFDLGSTIITVNVYNNATLTGGIIAKGATLTTQSTIQNVVVYGTLLTESLAPIKNCILLNPPEYRIGRSPSIQDCIIVNNPGNWKKTALTATDGAKITTIQLGNLTMKLDEPVSEIYFLPADNSTPEKLTVTLDDGTQYENIDLTQNTITLMPTKREDPTTYYTVIVEGGEARNERGDILDSEVVVAAGEKITLKLLDETQGEMVFSYWDVNNSNTDLADELAKTGFDKTAHETTFTMPAHDLILTAKYRMPEEDAPQDDSFLMTAAAVTGGALLTGLVVWQGYNIFSQVYLNAHLPEGTAIPTNRQQLALLLWNAAGQPEASAASYVFPDVAEPDAQTAARWATEQGLLKARKDGTFAPMDSVTTGQVYRAWQKVKTAG